MDVALLHTLYDAFAGDRSAFLYSGEFHDAHTARLIVLGEESTDEKENGKGLRTRLAFVLVEAYQNIIRHRAELPLPLAMGRGRSLMLWRDLTAGHEVTTMNPVTDAEAAHVAKQLAALHALDPEQLKERYLASLKRDVRTERGGAGLGLIEMARRSGNALRHHFFPIDAEHKLFALQVLVEDVPTDSRSWELFETLHHQISTSDLLLFRKGITTLRIQESIERIIEQELADTPERAVAAISAMRNLSDLLIRSGADSHSMSMALLRTANGHALMGGAQLDTHDAERLDELVKACNSGNDRSDAGTPTTLFIERSQSRDGLVLVLVGRTV